MYVAFAVGRVALALFFILSGVGKFLDIAGIADVIQSKLAIPAELRDLTSQIEAATGMSIWQILTILVAAVEVIGGVLIAFNVLTRTTAVVLLVFVAVTTFYFHDFWNVTSAAEKTNQMDHALKNLSIMGALLMLAAWPRWLMVPKVYAADRVDLYDTQWRRWFAWYPVVVWIERKPHRVWLRYVERKWGTSRLTGERKWRYRLISPPSPPETRSESSAAGHPDPAGTAGAQAGL